MRAQPPPSFGSGMGALPTVGSNTDQAGEFQASFHHERLMFGFWQVKKSELPFLSPPSCVAPAFPQQTDRLSRGLRSRGAHRYLLTSLTRQPPL